MNFQSILAVAASQGGGAIAPVSNEMNFDPTFNVADAAGRTLNGWSIPGDGTAVCSTSDGTLIIPASLAGKTIVAGNYDYVITITNPNGSIYSFEAGGTVVLSVVSSGTFTGTIVIGSPSNNNLNIVNSENDDCIVNKYSLKGPK